MIDNLPITEEIDFTYLLELMPVLNDKPEFAWLPELFSIVGPERLVLLCRYAGGEKITIPTLEELSTSVEAFQLFYDIKIKKTKTMKDLPPSLYHKFDLICDAYKDDA